MIRSLKSFFDKESASSLVLMAVSLAALLTANSPLATYYETFFSHKVTFFINDILMAIFFLLVGLEIRAEMHDGTLSTRAQALLPLVAALGGVITPALIYIGFTHGTEDMRGWAIPSATDIAFSLGVLALIGSRLPESLKIFLMAVAVIDDLAAVIIIALFYTAELSLPHLAGAVLCVGMLYVLAKRNVLMVSPYLIIGAILWFFVHASGVHATIAGVLLGSLIPPALAQRLIEKLHSVVAFGIIPLFAFANAGVPLAGVQLSDLSQPVTLGIIVGLCIGKPVGIYGAASLLTRISKTTLPVGVSNMAFLGVSMVAGIGFTMSLFIGGLAFSTPDAMQYVKLGVIAGSIISALLGAGLLYRSTLNKP